MEQCWGNIVLALAALGTHPHVGLTEKTRARRRALAWIASPLAARSLLRMVCRLRIGAHLLPRLVAPHLVQHALRPRASACARARPRLRSSAPRRHAPLADHQPASRFRPAHSPSRSSLRLPASMSSATARPHPLVYVEGTKNPQARLPYDDAIPPVLQDLLSLVRTRPC